MNDAYNLQRFVDAQRPVYDRVREELRRGRKASHWMWFIFPQIEGLGHSAMARTYAISSLDEAAAYLRHPVLGARLLECTKFVVEANAASIEDILGYPDDLKFRSSMTLFARVPPGNTMFRQALDKYFQGEDDPLTLERLQRGDR